MSKISAVYKGSVYSKPKRKPKKLVRKKVNSYKTPATKSKNYKEVNSPEFLKSFEWRKLRMEVIKKYGAKCQCCGASPSTGAVINVDHIKPRRMFPGLAMDINNLQILCADCNHGKGSWDKTDWRRPLSK